MGLVAEGQPAAMKCPACGVQNSPLSQHCTNCGKALPRPEDDRTLENVDRTGQPLPESPKGPTSQGPGAGSANKPSLGGGGTRPQREDSKDAQVISKTPSGVVGNDIFSKEDTEAGTIFGGEEHPAAPTPATSSYQSRMGASGLYMAGGLEPGMAFGPRFRIEQLLGEGGMGKVYKAYDQELGRTVALKILQPELTKDPKVVLRFKQELLLASKISHRNILRIHDLSEFDGVKFITMAFIEGRDLNQILKEGGPLTIDRAMKLGRQMCEALDAAHMEGVVHRDFKPHNVLVGKNDHVYVSDFGLATSFESAKLGMTRTGAFVGTPRYMSPEQVEGKDVDSRSDLYSLGLVLYEMVSGDAPFSGDSTWQIMYQRVKELPKNIKEANPNVPDDVAQIIMHCLERDPGARYQSAKEIVADIDAHRAPEMSTASMYRTSATAPVGGSTSMAGRSLQITIPEKPPIWLYISAGVVLLGGLFFAVPATRHLVIKPVAGTSVAVPENTVPGLPPLSQGKYIAVLPFRVLGDASSVGYVADGLGEALSAKLFQLKELHVASPEAARKIDPKMPLPQIAKKLGANMIVQGTVQGTPDQLRITVMLQNVAQNKTVSDEEFSGVPGDLLAIEDKIYAKLATSLEANTSDAEVAAASAHPTENTDAYDLYLRGRNALRGQVDTKTFQTAIDYFNQALKKDPNFALAYTGLANASLRMYSVKKDPAWSEKAVAAARRAVDLNDKLPEAHLTLGTVYMSTGQNSQGIAELKRGQELAPNSDEAYRRLGNAFAAIGQKDLAIEALEKAVEINPYFWMNENSLGQAYFSFGDYPRALKAFQQVVQLEPENASGYLNIGSSYVHMGKYEDSIGAFQKSIELRPDPQTYSSLATSLFFLKRYAEAVPMFEKAVEMNPSDQGLVGNLADGYRWAGQQDKAKETYLKAIALCNKELQVNPRSSDLLGQMALYYAKAGDLTKARELLQRAKAITPGSFDLYYTGATLEVIANRPTEAIAELKKALQKGQPAADVEADPELAVLHSRPDYQALIKEYSKR